MLSGRRHIERELLPKPVEALRGVRMGSVAAAGARSYALSDTGELWAWGRDNEYGVPLGHDEETNCPLPKLIGSLRGIKVDAVAASSHHTLVRANDGRLYSWGGVCDSAAVSSALGLGSSVRDARWSVLTPQIIPVLRVGCGF
jgi:alpha-tubulin suppressor-like RCC1 family protein